VSIHACRGCLVRSQHSLEQEGARWGECRGGTLQAVPRPVQASVTQVDQDMEGSQAEGCYPPLGAAVSFGMIPRLASQGPQQPQV
jgi:hypothetical protein